MLEQKAYVNTLVHSSLKCLSFAIMWIMEAHTACNITIMVSNYLYNLRITFTKKIWMELSHDHENFYILQIMAGSHAKLPSLQTSNGIQVQVETYNTHPAYFCVTSGIKRIPLTQPLIHPSHCCDLLKLLCFVEERKCHLENQQLAVTGLQDDSIPFVWNFTIYYLPQ